MDVSQKYVEFFLNCSSNIFLVECLKIAHPSFTQAYYVTRNYVDGFTCIYEDQKQYFHEFYPLKLSFTGSRDDLDCGVRIDFGDLGEIISVELDRVVKAKMHLIKPTVEYRAFRNDAPQAPIYGPLKLEIKSLVRDSDGASFDAVAQEINITRTGEVFDLIRFWPLRSFI